MKYELDPDTRALLAAVIAGEDVECEFYSTNAALWMPTDRIFGMLNQSYKLRRKPRTIRIGEYDVPETTRVVPASGTVYFVLNILNPEKPHQGQWGSEIDSEKIDLERLYAGLCQATKEGAITHGKALRSLTEVKPCPKTARLCATVQT